MPLFEHNFDEREQRDLMALQLADASARWKFKTHDLHGAPNICRLHDLAQPADNDKAHNCVACNLADSVVLLQLYLSDGGFGGDTQQTYTTFFILSYLLVERVDTLFNCIKLDDHYREKNFKILTEIRKWANFLKHPKAFILTHHAEWTYRDSPKNSELGKLAKVTIDRNFVNEFYSDDSKNDELYKRLENADNVLVIMPDLPRICEQLAEALEKTLQMFENNAIYRDALVARSTFLDYWIDEDGATNG